MDVNNSEWRKIMKKLIMICFSLLLATATFAQNNITQKNLVKTLEKNKDETAVFKCDINLSGIAVSNSGKVSLPIFAKSKVIIEAGMDMTNIKERIIFAKRSNFFTTFQTIDLKTKRYSITNIEGIETVEEYKARVAEEEKAQREKERLANLTKMPVQVVNQEIVNLSVSESSWLPGQVQDKFKENLQNFLGMKTVVDSKSEVALKKLQAESESEARDENTALEFGKITTAKFALFTKIRKTAKGYLVSVDFTDLTTGEQMASATSKEYSEVESLYGSTGAVDEITLSIGKKLGINISQLNQNLLLSGSATFSVDEQMALAKQNEENFNKMMAQYDSELEKLQMSNDINAIQNKNRIEAEKALLVEKQNAEKKRQAELTEQKKRAEEDAKLEAERSIALKTQRDKMAKDAADKAAEVRKLKLEKQGVLGQINVLEAKKKALVEIRNAVEIRSQELYEQLVKDRDDEEKKIRAKTYSTVELGSDGKPTEAALKRRENQIIQSYTNLTNKFFADCEEVKKSTATQDSSLLAEIRTDQKSLEKMRTVSSMGEELKVSFGTYEGSKNGWNAYLSLYSDGVLLYSDSFIVGYEAVSGKKAPNMETELDDKVIEEYTNNVDMYNSLLVRGDPILYFEIDYTAKAESDEKPSEYLFNFNKIRVINTVSGKVTQTSTLAKIHPRTMKPKWDLREFAGIAEKEKAEFDAEKYPVEVYMVKGRSRLAAEKAVAINKEIAKFLGTSKMVPIPGEDFSILNTEVTQKMYAMVMGENPSDFEGEDYPVVMVSWYDAIYFCNALSRRFGLEPAYSVDGNTDERKWDKGSIEEKINLNDNVDGFRLPYRYEWRYAAEGGENYKYSGSDNLDEVGWYEGNSNCRKHPVAQKKANGYGLYDMSGNVWEWVDSPFSVGRGLYGKVCGGSSKASSNSCIVDDDSLFNPYTEASLIGFRLVRSLK